MVHNGTSFPVKQLLMLHNFTLKITEYLISQNFSNHFDGVLGKLYYWLGNDYPSYFKENVANVQ